MVKGPKSGGLPRGAKYTGDGSDVLTIRYQISRFRTHNLDITPKTLEELEGFGYTPIEVASIILRDGRVLGGEPTRDLVMALFPSKIDQEEEVAPEPASVPVAADELFVDEPLSATSQEGTEPALVAPATSAISPEALVFAAAEEEEDVVIVASPGTEIAAPSPGTEPAPVAPQPVAEAAPVNAEAELLDESAAPEEKEKVYEKWEPGIQLKIYEFDWNGQIDGSGRQAELREDNFNRLKTYLDAQGKSVTVAELEELSNEVINNMFRRGEVSKTSGLNPREIAVVVAGMGYDTFMAMKQDDLEMAWFTSEMGAKLKPVIKRVQVDYANLLSDVNFINEFGSKERAIAYLVTREFALMAIDSDPNKRAQKVKNFLISIQRENLLNSCLQALSEPTIIDTDILNNIFTRYTSLYLAPAVLYKVSFQDILEAFPGITKLSEVYFPTIELESSFLSCLASYFWIQEHGHELFPDESASPQASAIPPTAADLAQEPVASPALLVVPSEIEPTLTEVIDSAQLRKEIEYLEDQIKDLPSLDFKALGDKIALIKYGVSDKKKSTKIRGCLVALLFKSS